MSEIAAILEVFSQWREAVGDLLAHEDPKLLVRIIELTANGEGSSQRPLQQALKINQPRLSKLSKKLAACKWVELQKSSADRRLVLMVATDLAKTRVQWLYTELSAIVAAPVPQRRKGFKLPRNQVPLF